MHDWDLCRREIDWASFDGEECHGCLDLAAVDDTNALCLLFMREGMPYFHWEFWLPANNVEMLERKHKLPYRQIAQASLLHLTPGNSQDHDKIIEHIKDHVSERFKVLSLAVDRKFQGLNVETKLFPK